MCIRDSLHTEQAVSFPRNAQKAAVMRIYGVCITGPLAGDAPDIEPHTV